MIEPLAISDVVVIKPKIFRDERGFFSETYNARSLAEHGITTTFVQDNQSLSRQSGVLRGLHFQAPPHAQAKIIRVVRGSIFDVAVDVRHGSPTFGQHVWRTLSAENWEQLLVPEGFAHGFCTLEPDTEVIYKTSDFYAPECERGILWNDPDLNIDWPVPDEDVILSPKDQSQPRLKDSPVCFEA